MRGVEEAQIERGSAYVGKHRPSCFDLVAALHAHRDNAPMANQDSLYSCSAPQCTAGLSHAAQEGTGDRLRPSFRHAEPTRRGEHCEYEAQRRSERIVRPDVRMQGETR
jgi:hypothetical protein